MGNVIKDSITAMHPGTTREEELTLVSNNQELTTNFNQTEIDHGRRATIKIQDLTNGTRDELKDLFINAPQNFLKKLGKRLVRWTLKPIPYAVLKLKGKIDFPIKTIMAGVLAAYSNVTKWVDMPFIKVSELSDKITGDNPKAGGPAASNDDMEMPKQKRAA